MDSWVGAHVAHAARNREAGSCAALMGTPEQLIEAFERAAETVLEHNRCERNPRRSEFIVEAGIRLQQSPRLLRLFRRAEREHDEMDNLRMKSGQPSLPDTTHGNCHLLLAFILTIKSLPALAKVVEDCAARISF